MISGISARLGQLRVGLAWSALAMTGLFARRVPAEPMELGPLSLEVSGPAGCADAAGIVHRAEALLRGRVQDALRSPLRAQIVILERAPGEYLLTFESVQGNERWTRSVAGRSCEELADAGALILALAVDPMLAEHQAAPAGDLPPAPASPQPMMPAEPSSPVTPPVAETPSARPRTRFGQRIAVELAGVADGGSLAHVAPGIGLALRYAAPRFEIGLGGIWLPPQKALAGGRSDRGGDVDLLAIDLSGCFVPSWGGVRSSTCALFEAGSISAEGFGAAETHRKSRAWIAPGLSQATQLRLHDRLSLRLAVWGLAPLRRPDFVLVNVGRVHQPAPVVVRLSIGLNLQFQ